MKVRVIAGIREVNISDPLCGTWIEFVSFPMVVTNYEVESPEDPEEIMLHNEDDLIAWANVAFEYDGYEIWDAHVPLGALVRPNLRTWLVGTLTRTTGGILARVQELFTTHTTHATQTRGGDIVRKDYP